MEISLILAEEITKLFIIMAMGWALVRARVLKTEDSRVISAIIVYLVAPCIIISSFQIEHSRQVVGGPCLLLRPRGLRARALPAARGRPRTRAAPRHGREADRRLHQRGHTRAAARAGDARRRISRLLLRLHRRPAHSALDALPQRAERQRRDRLEEDTVQPQRHFLYYSARCSCSACGCPKSSTARSR